jgi:hypothetical protein
MRLDVARDGTVARIYAGDELQAVMAPLAPVNGDIPDWTAHRDNTSISLQGSAGLAMRFDADGVLAIRTYAELEMETVIRVVGGLEQAVFPGLEYLGKGEHSSSRLDFHTDQHFRYMPKARELTWPAMMVVTVQQSVALRWNWNDTGVQPTFASPNFVDGASDHRMTLRGKMIRARLRLTPSAPVSNSILWAAQDMGLPPLPTRPRSDADQAALCRKAYEGPLRSPNGWGHCVEENYPRKWYADLASAYWALGGDLATLPDLLPGGGHIRDNRSLFLTNRAKMWLQMRRAEVQRVMQAMQADGSFRYNGEYRKGHFEDTASGHCAKQTPLKSPRSRKRECITCVHGRRSGL